VTSPKRIVPAEKEWRRRVEYDRRRVVSSLLRLSDWQDGLGFPEEARSRLRDKIKAALEAPIGRYEDGYAARIGLPSHPLSKWQHQNGESRNNRAPSDGGAASGADDGQIEKRGRGKGKEEGRDMSSRLSTPMRRKVIRLGISSGR
jgi:hypothetical protein